MLVIEKRCPVCMVVKKDKQLLQRIYDSSWFVPHSRDNLKDIQRDYSSAFSYDSIRNHVKKHQFIDSVDYTEKMLQHADKRAEQKAIRKAVKATDAVQNVIDRGMQRLEEGEIDVDTNQLIRASQIKIGEESKQKDRELATIEMVAHFLSGANQSDKIYIEPDETT